MAGRKTAKPANGAFSRFAQELPPTVRPLSEEVEQLLTIAADSSVSGAQGLNLLRSWGMANPALYLMNGLAPVLHTASANSDFVGWYLADVQLYDLLDEMADRDSAIGSAEGIIRDEVLEFEERIEPDDAEDAAQAEFARMLETHLFNLSGGFGWDALRGGLASYARRHGSAVFEIVWGRDLLPQMFLHRHPGQFAYSTTGQVYIIGSRRGTSLETAPAPPRKLVRDSIPAPYGNPYGQPVIFPLRFLYFFKKNGLAAWIDGVETYGLPRMVVKAPAGNDQAQMVRTIRSAIESLRRTSAVVLPEGYQVDNLPVAAGSGVLPHHALLDYLDREMTRFLRGSTLSSMENSGTGSLAQSLTHERTAKNIPKAAARRLQRAINEHVIKPVCELAGVRFPFPSYVIDTDDARDVKEVLDIFSKAKELGVETSLSQFREWAGLAAPKDEEDAIKPGAPAPEQPPPVRRPLLLSSPLDEADRMGVDLHALDTDEEPPDSAIFADPGDADAAWREWRAVVNMDAEQMRAWDAHSFSRRASLSRAPILRHLHLLATPPERWGRLEVQFARRAVAFISAKLAQPDGPAVSKQCPLSRRVLLLRNWGRDAAG